MSLADENAYDEEPEEADAIMKKRSILCIAIFVVLMLSLVGCTYKEEVVPVDTETASLETNYETGQTSVTDEIQIPGESFSLVCTYDTGDYQLDNWRVTASKGINMSVNTKGLPEGYKTYIEHMHADIVLKKG